VLAPVRTPEEAATIDRRALRPVSATWRTAYPVALDDIHTSGFGLHALRDPPLVGREPQRDRLWSLLAEVADTGRGRVVHLTGPDGSGRRTLARWFTTRAAELAIATTEGPTAGPGPHIRVTDAAPAEVEPGVLALVPSREAPPGAEVLPVPRMSEGEVRRLLDHRVRLDPLLNARLAWLADGHPGRAVALLAKVVPRLVPGPDGPVLEGPLPPTPAFADDAASWGDRPTHRDHDPPRPDHPDLLRRALALPPDQAEALLFEAGERPHLALRFPVETVGVIDAMRRLAGDRAPSDPLRLRADILEGWILVNLHLHDRAVAIAEAVLAADAPHDAQRDAHLILAKAYRGQGLSRRLPHIHAASELPPHPKASYRLRHWRLLIMALRELDARDEIDALLDQIAADPELTTWSRIEHAHEARRRGESIDLDPILDACRDHDDAELVKAAAGLAFAAGRHGDGEAFLKSLLDRGQDSAVLRCNLGWIIASQGRLDEVPPLITTVTEADADVLSSLALLKAYVHAEDPQLDAEAYLDRFQPHLIGAAFREHTCKLLEDLATRAEDAGLYARAVLARRHASWLRSR